MPRKNVPVPELHFKELKVTDWFQFFKAAMMSIMRRKNCLTYPGQTVRFVVKHNGKATYLVSLLRHVDWTIKTHYNASSGVVYVTSQIIVSTPGDTSVTSYYLSRTTSTHKIACIGMYE